MAVTLAPLFFPSNNPTASLLVVYLAFAVNGIARPVGGAFMGNLGDKIGRKNALAIIIIGMAVVTAAIGFLPTYAQIGVLAPILLFALQFAQGFVSGADYGAGSSFIIEYAPESRRGFYGSWQQFAMVGGSLLASAAIALLTNAVPEQTLNAWAWRVPFILALLPGLFGFYLRVTVPDSPKFRELDQSHEVSRSPLRDALRDHWKPILVAGGVFLFWAVSQQSTFVYQIGYVTTVGGLSLPAALSAYTIGLVLFAALIPVFGLLTDRIGRKPLLIGSCLGFVFLSVPMFMLMAQGTYLSFLAAQSIFAVFLAMMSGAAPAALVELFPTKVRVVSVTIGTNVTLAILGFPTPALQAWLIGATGNDLAPALWLIVTAIITMLVVIFAIKETARQPLD
jgi:MHS family proline/betaine transporter-like MFS transporter